ncbi:MAG: hypothetical protein H6742_17155 [Alphaproteobacteria bacterium]|nr:hypothetical protein [Alphaproteobacteria bacterium]
MLESILLEHKVGLFAGKDEAALLEAAASGLVRLGTPSAKRALESGARAGCGPGRRPARRRCRGSSCGGAGHEHGAGIGPRGGLGALPGRLALDQPGVEAAKAERARRRAVADHARELAVQLDALGRTLTFHEASNAAVRHVLARVEESLAGLRATGRRADCPKNVSPWSSRRARLRQRRLVAGHAAVLGRHQPVHRAAGGPARSRVVLDLPRLTADSLLGVARILRVYRDFDPEAVRPLGGVRLIPLPADAGRLRDAAARRRVEALELFEEGLAVCDPERLASLDLYARRRQRALVLGMVQMAEEGTEELLSLTALRESGSLTDAAHDLVVAILSVCIGRAMDLSCRDLLRLGVSAISHNVGEAFLPEELRKVPRSLAPTERDRLETHPCAAPATCCRPTASRRAPSTAPWSAPSTTATTTASAATRPDPASPTCSPASSAWPIASPRWPRTGPTGPRCRRTRPSRSCCAARAPELDPLLVRSFVRVVGRFPPGSCVELDTGEVAVVLAPARAASRWPAPRCCWCATKTACRSTRPSRSTWARSPPRRRAWLRTIARTRDPGRLSLDVANLVFGDRAQVAPTHLDTTVMAT